MNDTQREDRMTVYEIGYLLAGIPEEKVGEEAAAVSGLITSAGASVIAEESPKHERLAYEMRKKTVSGAYEKYDSAYFGWIKFEAAAGTIEGVKKAVEAHPSVLRTLVITTVRENTYLGKRAPFAASAFPARRPGPSEGEQAPSEKKDVPPATIEEMDKSIDEMVKEA